MTDSPSPTPELGDEPPAEETPGMSTTPATPAAAETVAIAATPATPATTSATPVAGSAVGTAMAAARRRNWLIFIGLAIAVVVVDQLAKAWIVGNFDVGSPSQLLGDWVRIWLSHNSGALFGMFRDQALIFAFFSFLVIAVIVWYQAKAGGSLLVTLALGLLLGGALGNLADRLRVGYVVDFMDIGIGSWRFYPFNVADSAISGAVLLLLLLAIVPGLAAVNRDD